MSDFNIRKYLTENVDTRYDPQLIAQDMHDGGMAAISEESFDELYDEYCRRYNDPNIKGDMQLRAETMDAYKRILRAGTAGGNGRIGAGAKGRGRVTEGPIDWAKEKLGMGSNPTFGDDPYDNPEELNAREPSDEEYERAVHLLSTVSGAPIGSVGVNGNDGTIYVMDSDGEEYEIKGSDIEHVGSEFPTGPGDARGFESVQTEGGENIGGFDGEDYSGGHDDSDENYCS